MLILLVNINLNSFHVQGLKIIDIHCIKEIQWRCKETLFTFRFFILLKLSVQLPATLVITSIMKELT